MKQQDRKPEVGQDVWHFDFGTSPSLRQSKISGRPGVKGIDASWLENGSFVYWEWLFPTPEAALASIKIIDIDGHEVEMVGTDMDDFETWMAKNPDVDNAATELWEKLKARGLVGPMPRPIPIRTPEEEMAILAERGIHHVDHLPKDGLGEIEAVYDTVTLPAAGAIPVHFIGVCSECKKEIDLSRDTDAVAAMEKMVNLARNVEFPQNPDGAARLKAAQERFAALGKNQDGRTFDGAKLHFMLRDEAGQCSHRDLDEEWKALCNELTKPAPLKLRVRRGKKYTKPKNR